MLIMRGRYRVFCVTNAVLPPISSKVLKYVIERYGCEYLKSLTSSRRAFKPIQISPLFLNGKPLFSQGTPLSPLRAGSVLMGTISVATPLDGADPSVLEISGKFATPYGTFDVELTELEVVALSKYGAELSKFFKVVFVTPTVLTGKYMIPPPLKVKSRSLPERHRLMPQPSFIFSYLLRFWNALAEPEERIPGPGAGDWEAYKLGRLADVTLVEVDYRVRPATVVIGKDSSGRLRRVRGFIGWVIYECLSKKLLPIYSKLLGLAQYLGIGRSRGIGLGMVTISSINEGRKLRGGTY